MSIFNSRRYICNFKIVIDSCIFEYRRHPCICIHTFCIPKKIFLSSGICVFFQWQPVASVQWPKIQTLLIDRQGGINDRHVAMPRNYAEIYLGAWKFLGKTKMCFWWRIFMKKLEVLAVYFGRCLLVFSMLLVLGLPGIFWWCWSIILFWLVYLYM